MTETHEALADLMNSRGRIDRIKIKQFIPFSFMVIDEYSRTCYISRKMLDNFKLVCGALVTDKIVSLFGIPVEGGL